MIKRFILWVLRFVLNVLLIPAYITMLISLIWIAGIEWAKAEPGTTKAVIDAVRKAYNEKLQP